MVLDHRQLPMQAARPPGTREQAATCRRQPDRCRLRWLLQEPPLSTPTMAALGPGDLPAVFECLRLALSHDSATQKQAEATLRGLEPRPGFCSCLAVSGGPPLAACSV